LGYQPRAEKMLNFKSETVENFVAYCLLLVDLVGLALLDELDGYIKAWHRESRGMSLKVALGLTHDEYCSVVAERSCIDAIVAKERLKLETGNILMRFVATSDVHNLWGELTPLMQPADVLIVAGDMGTGESSDREQLLSWLKGQYYAHKIVVGGNWDRWIDDGTPLEIIKKLFSDVGATYLCHEPYEITMEGHMVRVFGSPYTPRFANMSFEEYEDELEERFEEIPVGLDILITHGPAEGILDWNRENVPCGSPALIHAIERKRPKVHVFGHIHDGYGVAMRPGGQVSLNVALCGMSKYFEPRTNPPLVFDLFSDGTGWIENTGESFGQKKTGWEK
jgi:Icc-related predicted phosphoesterase